VSQRSTEEALRALDAAAQEVAVDGGAGFAACRPVVEQAREDTGDEWLNELEQVLWLLDDGLQDPIGPEPSTEVVMLAAAAANDWRSARAPGGEGAQAYAGRWLRVLRERWGPRAAEIAVDRERAERALDVVRRDLTASLPGVVNLRIESSEGGTHWVTDDDGSSFGEFIETGHGAALLLATVAGNAQTVVIDASGRLWPECTAHHSGLDATIKSGHAVWECRLGGHVIPIGRLADGA
jgi:hypothetical protein